ELGGDFVGHAVGEEAAIGIGAEILQWKNGDGWFGRGGWGDRRSRKRAIPKRAGDDERKKGERSAALEEPRPAPRGSRGGIAGTLGLRRDGGGEGGRIGFALDAAEIGAKVGGGLVTHGAIFFERFVNDALEFGGDGGIEAHGRDGSAIEDSVKD